MIGARQIILLKLKIKKMEKKYLEWLVPGMVLIILISLIIFVNREKALGAAAGWLDAYSSTTNVATTITVGLGLKSGTSTVTGLTAASSTQVLASNSVRVYARLTNINTNGYVVSCLLGSTATSTANIGIVIPPMASNTPLGSFELGKNNPYSGAVFCYAQSTSTIAVTEN